MKTEVEMTLYKILGIMIREDGLSLTDTVIAEMLRVDKSVAIDALTLGLKRELIEFKQRHFYSINDSGINEYSDAIDKKYFVINNHSFKDEVLTGMDANGNQTKIKNAALPATEKRYSKTRDLAEVRLIDDVSAVLKLCEETGDTIDTIREGLLSGRIGLCNSGGQPHWGKFHKKGNGYRTICAVCRGAK